jgi:hypothetical protein
MCGEEDKTPDGPETAKCSPLCTTCVSRLECGYIPLVCVGCKNSKYTALQDTCTTWAKASDLGADGQPAAKLAEEGCFLMVTKQSCKACEVVS